MEVFLKQGFGILLFFLLLVTPLLFGCGCGDDDDDDDSGGDPPGDDDTTDDDAADDDATDDDDAACTGCLIDSVCYPDGVQNPDNPCLVCDAAAAEDAWSDNDGAVCDDGEYCNGADVCASGACDQHAGDPCDAQCQTCNEETGACDNTEGACDDGIFCNGADTCDNGSCGAHTGDPCDIDEACEEPDACTPACFEDTDRDGTGDAESWQERDGDCPYGWVADKTDCDPEVYLTHPGAFDLPDDGIDQNCDGFDFKADDTVGIFVDGSVKAGPPACAGTMDDPCPTITAGLIVADMAGKKNVFVAGGTYIESVYSYGISLFGGYDGSDWSRDIDANQTIIQAPTSNALYITSMVDSPLSPVVVEGFTINADDSGTVSPMALLANYAATQLIGNEIDGGEGLSYSGGAVVQYSSSLLAYNNITGGIGSGTSYGVLTYYSNSTLVGNTITGGTPDNSAFGLYAISGNVTLIRNEIEGGTPLIKGVDAASQSIGVLSSSCSILAEGNTLSGGTNFDTAGISLRYGSSKLIGNDIEGGSNAFFASGVRLQFGTHTLQGNTIRGGNESYVAFGLYSSNSASSTVVNNDIRSGTGYYAYGMLLRGGQHDVIHNTVDGGESWNDGMFTTGIDINSDTDADLINNIISGGSGDDVSIALNIDMSVDVSTVDLYGNDIWNADDCLLTYYDGSSHCLDLLADINNLTWAEGNVSADPSFDTDGLHLTSGSTAVIDMGWDFSSYYSGNLADTDFDGEDRPNGSAPDIGADEYYTAKK